MPRSESARDGGYLFRGKPFSADGGSAPAALAEQADSNTAQADASITSGDGSPRPKSVDKSTLSFPEPRRIRDKAHKKFVAQQPCLICGRRPSDAHHLRFTQPRALSRKVSDEFTVPLCRTHHREVHRK